MMKITTTTMMVTSVHSCSEDQLATFFNETNVDVTVNCTTPH
jgi:hypothetical protein